MTALLVLLAFLITGSGLILTSSATAGVYLASVGCLLAITARIAQARAHQAQLLARLDLRAAAATAQTRDLDAPSG